MNHSIYLEGRIDVSSCFHVNRPSSNTYGHLSPGKPLCCLLGILCLPTQHNIHLGARWTFQMEDVIPPLVWLNSEWHLNIPDSPRALCSIHDCTSLEFHQHPLHSSSGAVFPPKMWSFDNLLELVPFQLMPYRLDYCLVLLHDFPASSWDSLVFRS